MGYGERIIPGFVWFVVRFLSGFMGGVDAPKEEGGLYGPPFGVWVFWLLWWGGVVKSRSPQRRGSGSRPVWIQ